MTTFLQRLLSIPRLPGVLPGIVLTATCLTIGLVSSSGFCEDTMDKAALNAERLFATDHVVEISIEIEQDDWDTLRYESRSLAEALEKTSPPQSPFHYAKADVSIDGVRVEGVGIRKKGFYGSLDEQRPSLKIKFSEFQPDHKSNPPIAGIDRLTLNNNKQDPAGASQLLGYGIFRDTGIHAPRCNAAHVTVNGKDLGIYSNVESVRKSFFQRTFGEGSIDDDYGAHFEGTVADFHGDSISRFESKNKAANHALLSTVAELLDQDTLDLEALDRIIDINAFIRFWATESLIGFWDGYSNNMNNFFVYQDPKDSRLHFVPWGVDCAFSENMPLPPFIIRPQFVYTQSRLANRLYRDDNTRDKYLAQMRVLLEEHWDEERLLTQIDELEARVGAINTRKKEFGKSLQRIRKFIQVRRRKLNREMDNGYELTKTAKRPAYSKTIGKVTATFDTQWYDEVPKETKDLGTHEITLMINNERISFREMGVYAQHSTWPPRPDSEPKPPAIVFHGNREDGVEMTIGIGMPIPKFTPNGDVSMRVEGMLIEGKIGWPGTTYNLMGGTVTLQHAKMESGARVQGGCELIAREIVNPKPQPIEVAPPSS